MVNLVSFSFGIVVIAFVVTCVMILFLVILPQMRKTGRSFSSMSYFIIALFGGLLLLCNIIFGGLLKTKSELDEIEHSLEFRGIQYVDELLSVYAPDAHSILANVLYSDNIVEQIEQKKIAIKKYLWIDGVFELVLFLLGLLLISESMQNVLARRSYTSQRNSDGRQRRERERSYRNRHR